MAFKVSLAKPGLASDEGYIEVRGVEAFWCLADGESPSLVCGRTCGDVLPSAAAESLRRAITCGLGAENGRGADTMMGQGWLSLLLRAMSLYGSKSASRSCLSLFPILPPKKAHKIHKGQDIHSKELA